MVQVDLITGFLGAGKTTFLRRYAAWWAGQGVRVCVLENDFGAVNVDAMLLQDLEAVSYTHLTLPTKRIVEISGVAVALKKKIKQKKKKYKKQER